MFGSRSVLFVFVIPFFVANGFLMGVMVLIFALPNGSNKFLWNSTNG